MSVIGSREEHASAATDALETELLRLRTVVAAARRDAAGIDLERVAWERRAADLLDEARGAREALDEARATAGADLDHVQGENARLQAENARLSAEVTAARDEASAANAELSAIRARIRVFERRSLRHRLGSLAHKSRVVRRIRAGRRDAPVGRPAHPAHAPSDGH